MIIEIKNTDNILRPCWVCKNKNMSGVHIISKGTPKHHYENFCHSCFDILHETIVEFWKENN